MIVKQGRAYQSRPTFKLYHSDYASSGIWTLGSKLEELFESDKETH